jgi:hypothetical protein
MFSERVTWLKPPSHNQNWKGTPNHNSKQHCSSSTTGLTNWSAVFPSFKGLWSNYILDSWHIIVNHIRLISLLLDSHRILLLPKQHQNYTIEWSTAPFQQNHILREKRKPSKDPSLLDSCTWINCFLPHLRIQASPSKGTGADLNTTEPPLWVAWVQELKRDLSAGKPISNSPI